MLRTLRRLRRSAAGIVVELKGACNLTSHVPSLLRYGADVILYRVLFFTDLPTMNRERRIRVRGGLTITYRLNRGDIQSVREVLVDQCYRLPFELAPRVIVDLGANIGLTSLWLARRYHPEVLIAVEPSPINAALLRTNLATNGVRAQVVESAVGPADGTTCFARARDFNQGSIAAAGDERVPMLSMESVLRRCGEGRAVDLVKMDIEGGEQQLLTSDLGWLDRVRALIVEFHPAVVDYPGLLSVLRRAGFRYVKYNVAQQESMDSFIRDASA